jgi:hypothetical protein
VVPVRQHVVPFPPCARVQPVQPSNNQPNDQSGEASMSVRDYQGFPQDFPQRLM